MPSDPVERPDVEQGKDRPEQRDSSGDQTHGVEAATEVSPRHRCEIVPHRRHVDRGRHSARLHAQPVRCSDVLDTAEHVEDAHNRNPAAAAGAASVVHGVEFLPPETSSHRMQKPVPVDEDHIAPHESPEIDVHEEARGLVEGDAGESGEGSEPIEEGLARTRSRRSPSREHRPGTARGSDRRAASESSRRARTTSSTSCF